MDTEKPKPNPQIHGGQPQAARFPPPNWAAEQEAAIRRGEGQADAELEPANSLQAKPAGKAPRLDTSAPAVSAMLANEFEDKGWPGGFGEIIEQPATPLPPPAERLDIPPPPWANLVEDAPVIEPDTPAAEASDTAVNPLPDQSQPSSPAPRTRVV